jgi:hypothetical protein
MSCSEIHDCSDLVLFLEGEVTQTRAEEIKAHLAVCQPCRERLEQDKQIVEALSVTDSELERSDLVSLIRSRNLQSSKPVPRRFGLLPLCLGAAAAAGLAIVMVVLHLSSSSEFGVKGTSPGAFEQDRWVGLQVYQVRGADAQPSRLGEELSSGADLLFSYSNTGKDPFKCLMVFAIDSQGAVHWFYPAFLEAGSDPASIEISPGERIELRERIRHAYAPGTLTIIGLFTRAPVRVSEVEALDMRGGGARIPVEDSAQRVVTTRVLP